MQQAYSHEVDNATQQFDFLTTKVFEKDQIEKDLHRTWHITFEDIDLSIQKQQTLEGYSYIFQNEVKFRNKQQILEDYIELLQETLKTTKGVNQQDAEKLAYTIVNICNQKFFVKWVGSTNDCLDNYSYRLMERQDNSKGIINIIKEYNAYVIKQTWPMRLVDTQHLEKVKVNNQVKLEYIFNLEQNTIISNIECHSDVSDELKKATKALTSEPFDVFNGLKWAIEKDELLQFVKVNQLKPEDVSDQLKIITNQLSLEAKKRVSNETFVTKLAEDLKTVKSLQEQINNVGKSEDVKLKLAAQLLKCEKDTPEIYNTLQKLGMNPLISQLIDLTQTIDKDKLLWYIIEKKLKPEAVSDQLRAIKDQLSQEAKERVNDPDFVTKLTEDLKTVKQIDKFFQRNQDVSIGKIARGINHHADANKFQGDKFKTDNQEIYNALNNDSRNKIDEIGRQLNALNDNDRGTIDKIIDWFKSLFSALDQAEVLNLIVTRVQTPEVQNLIVTRVPTPEVVKQPLNLMRGSQFLSK